MDSIRNRKEKRLILINLGGGRKLKDPEMERNLLAWYRNYHEISHRSVTAKLMKQKALELTKCKDFIASKGWLEKFRKQYKINLIRETTANKLEKELK